MPDRIRLRPSSSLLVILPLLALVVAPTPAHAQRTKIITGPSAVYQRGYGPVFPANATFGVQAGSAAPIVTPNFSNVPSFGPNGAPRPVPFLSTGPGYSAYPYPNLGFGYGFDDYGYGSGYGYGYQGYNYGYNSAGALYPEMPMGPYGPSRAIINNGYYRR